MIKPVRFLALFFVSTVIACIVACMVWGIWFVLVGGTITFFPVMQPTFSMILAFNVFYCGMKVLLED